MHGITAQLRQLQKQHSEFKPFQLMVGEHLFSSGNKADYVYWLEQGLLRAYFVTAEGKEFTKEFYWEGDVIYGLSSLLSDEALPYSVVAIEDCQLQRIPVKEYRRLIDNDVQWTNYHHQQMEQHILVKERKEAFLLLQNPEQRVMAFYRNFPFLVPRISGYLIASYLGMTPISYSRIKSRLKLT
ncbi:MAG: Crp/Fnr family transcriptional regulator [Colwellia sp.]|nr:Crp/Fnr family transcriptional regulator [Colwellia sp.]MCW8864223.1 Crp/Fnr family transcriptional regulator [Colwellia sp.]MCW9082563.1 Crp/Fnr family transcriptional regulator [Colwellia sp.]